MLDEGGLGKHPKAFAALFKKGDSGAIKNLCQQIKLNEDLANLSGLLEKGGLGAKPECFGQLVATGFSNPQELKTFAKHINDKLPILQSLLGVKPTGEVDPEAEGGLGDNPEVFAHLFTTGCSKDPEKFKTFLSTFDSTGVKNLNKLVKEGGFAKHQIQESKGSGMKDVVDPAALGKFLAVGCAGNPADLKTLCETLSSSPEGLKGLKNLMQSGGLGAKPDCLSQFFATGVKDDSGVGATATKFDEMLKTLDKPELLSKMQGLLGVKPNGLSNSTFDGGLGDNGEVFGQLIATGCEKDPAKLKSLLETFDESGLQGLNKLVKDGGFASHELKKGKAVRKQVEYPPGTKVNAVDPKCLGKLLETGCDKDPAKLKDLCKALTNEQRKSLQGCMETGRLGEDPDVIGYLYQIGCDKTPTDMQAFCNAFNTPVEQKKLQNLMKKGGFNGKPTQKKPATLGKVLKDAFKDGTTPHPEKLLDLHDAFTGVDDVTGAENLAKMERMFNAYNTPPVPGVKEDDPGKKLKRVMKALNIQNPGDFVKLQTTYYNKLAEAKKNEFDRKPDGTEYASDDEFLESLLANSATLDLSPVALHTNPSPPPPLTDYDGNVRDCHFFNRHGRPFQDINNYLTWGNPVSFWPEGFDGPAIMNQFNRALAFTTTAATLNKTNGGVFNKASYVKTPGTTTTPPVYYGAGDPIDARLVQLAGSNNYLKLLITQDGRKLVIGFQGAGNGVVYPQFYPESGPDIVKFTFETIRTYMKPALGK